MKKKKLFWISPNSSEKVRGVQRGRAKAKMKYKVIEGTVNFILINVRRNGR